VARSTVNALGDRTLPHPTRRSRRGRHAAAVGRWSQRPDDHAL